MSNPIRLQNPINPVNLILSTEPMLVSQGSVNYVYTQSSASNTWIVNHNLNKYCSVTVVDSNNDVVIGEIHYNSVNQVTLTFTAAFAGKAFFN
jgi:hypothetical protein